jgi:hypothetical protein
MYSTAKKPYEAPSVQLSGRFVEETRRNVQTPQETDDILPMFPAGSVGFGL